MASSNGPLRVRLEWVASAIVRPAGPMAEKCRESTPSSPCCEGNGGRGAGYASATREREWARRTDRTALAAGPVAAASPAARGPRGKPSTRSSPRRSETGRTRSSRCAFPRGSARGRGRRRRARTSRRWRACSRACPFSSRPTSRPADILRRPQGRPASPTTAPERNAPAVQRLVDAGAIVLGSTNMDELALYITGNNAAYGPIRNPHAPDRIAGGSSGGNGAALAAGSRPVRARYTDTGGSVRIPGRR